MSETKPRPGAISWVDLTVKEAGQLRDFYSKVVGWRADPVNMGDYNDYCMKGLPGDGQSHAVICHARGMNAELPPQWRRFWNQKTISKARIRASGLLGHYGEYQRPPRSVFSTVPFSPTTHPRRALIKATAVRFSVVLPPWMVQ